MAEGNPICIAVLERFDRAPPRGVRSPHTTEGRREFLARHPQSGEEHEGKEQRPGDRPGADGRSCHPGDPQSDGKDRDDGEHDSKDETGQVCWRLQPKAGGIRSPRG